MHELLAAAGRLVDEARGLSPDATASFRSAVDHLREQAQDLALAGEAGDAPGLLSDCLTSLLLSCRALERGDTDRRDECLEQATLFAAAAEQSSRNPSP